MAGCFGYVINIMADIVYPSYADLGIDGWVRLPATLGEIGTCLWLVVMGAKEYPLGKSN